MTDFVMPAAHQGEDPDFNAKAPSYKTATFTDEAHALLLDLPPEPVRVKFAFIGFNALFNENEPVFMVYRSMEDTSFIGHYFARALQEFVL